MIWGDRREIRNRITRILPFGAPTLKDRRATRGGEIIQCTSYIRDTLGQRELSRNIIFDCPLYQTHVTLVECEYILL